MTDRITLRFLATPQDSTTGGEIPAGSVLEWIDRAGYACAVAWSSSYCVTAYVGNVHFRRPISASSLVQARARIIHTGRTSMQVLVEIEAADVATREFETATHCLLVFVAVDRDGSPAPVPAWSPRDEAERSLNESAESRLAIRRTIRDAMLAEDYTEQGTTPRTTFRFLAAPAVANYGGNAHGGTVMRWIDEVAFACAASWSSARAVAVYSGGIHFFRPIKIGDLVETEARLIHTGPHSMHIAVHVRSAPPTDPTQLTLTTHCMTIFVDRGTNGVALDVAPVDLASPEDRRLDGHARELISARAQLPPILVG